MNTSILERAVDAHLAAYANPDAAARMAAIRALWSQEGRLVDPPMEGRGHAGISDLAATLLSQFPGHRFERSTAIDAHHDFARYGWRLLDPLGAEVLEGVDFVQFDVDGRIARIVGFFGSQSAAR
ncbi:MAG: hypothetical protein K0R89_1983 [Ramlibacter sp.]|jgi:hypothetical protein|nr:hypothetical protein [Ramlibacter sp.]